MIDLSLTSTFFEFTIVNIVCNWFMILSWKWFNVLFWILFSSSYIQTKSRRQESCLFCHCVLHRIFFFINFFIFMKSCSLRIQQINKSCIFTYQLFIHVEFLFRRCLFSLMFKWSFAIRRFFLTNAIKIEIKSDIFNITTRSMIQHQYFEFMIEFHFRTCDLFCSSRKTSFKESRVRRVLINIMSSFDNDRYYFCLYIITFFIIRIFKSRSLWKTNCVKNVSRLLIWM